MTRPLLALALACTAPAKAPVPDMAYELQRQVERVDHLAWETLRAKRIEEAENAVLLARTRKERAVAMRGLIVARRTP